MLRSCCRAACRAASGQWRAWPEVVVPAGGVQQPPPPWHSPRGVAERGVTTSAPRWGIEDFLDTARKPGEYPKAGRGWEAEDLRRKSFDDLHKLWYVLLKERNMLATERAAARSARDRFLNPLRLGKVRKSMARIKLVLTERAIEEHKRTGDFMALAEAKARINQL